MSISIRVLNTFTIWRLQILWCKRYFSLWWLTDWKYFKNHRKHMWGTEKPLLKLGDSV